LAERLYIVEQQNRALTVEHALHVNVYDEQSEKFKLQMTTIQMLRVELNDYLIKLKAMQAEF